MLLISYYLLIVGVHNGVQVLILIEQPLALYSIKFIPIALAIY